MPGLDLSALSSNWKKLQNTLKADEKRHRASNGLKRKRNEIYRSTKHSTSTKTGEPERGGSALAVKRRKMGSHSSTPAAPSASDTARSKLANEHDIAGEDIAAAYGSAKTSFADELNGGLHSTHKVGKYIALDCEMVGTGPPPHDDNVLARVSVVNYNGEQVYDSYVVPPSGITVKDYRTHVSGIQPSHLLEGYARSFVDVQRDVAALLQGRVLVGHALRNDFRVLLLRHPDRDIRDTSRHRRFREKSAGRPPALRQLALDELGLAIQTGAHSSVEDARAAMMLFRKERAGFEAANAKRFGRHTGLVGGRGMQIATTPSGDVEDERDDGEDDDLDDADAPDGELDGNDESRSNGTALKSKKKHKKKKNTKR